MRFDGCGERFLGGRLLDCRLFDYRFFRRRSFRNRFRCNLDHRFHYRFGFRYGCGLRFRRRPCGERTNSRQRMLCGQSGFDFAFRLRLRLGVLGEGFARQHHEVVAGLTRVTGLRLFVGHFGLHCGACQRCGFNVVAGRVKLGFRDPAIAATATTASASTASAATLISASLSTTAVAATAVGTPICATVITAIRAFGTGLGSRRERNRTGCHDSFGCGDFREGLGFGQDNRRGSARFHLEDLFLNGADYRVVLVVILEEIGYIKERVALQSDVYECGLHSRQDAGDAAFMDTAGEGIFFFALVENFHKLIVFEDRYSRLVLTR